MLRRKCNKAEKTRIIVHCDAGFSNTLYIRGEGTPDLSWNKGKALKNVTNNVWEWECDSCFNKGSFKIVLNDSNFEVGENHPLSCGKTIDVTPNF